MKTYKEYKKEQPMVECPNCHIKIKVCQPLPLSLGDEYHEDMYISHEDEYFERKRLEERNKNLEDLYDTYELFIKNLTKRNKELEDGFKATMEELTEYATKCEKAIEYIEEHKDGKITIVNGCEDIEYIESDDLLHILKGDDNE